MDVACVVPVQDSWDRYTRFRFPLLLFFFYCSMGLFRKNGAWPSCSRLSDAASCRPSYFVSGPCGRRGGLGRPSFSIRLLAARAQSARTGGARRRAADASSSARDWKSTRPTRRKVTARRDESVRSEKILITSIFYFYLGK